jgi:hypothetical protein
MTGPGSDHDSAASEDVARAAAAEVVNRHLGTPPGRLERENSGLSNFVFAVEHAAGSFVVRIAMDRARVDCYRKEKRSASRRNSDGRQQHHPGRRGPVRWGAIDPSPLLCGNATLEAAGRRAMEARRRIA